MLYGTSAWVNIWKAGVKHDCGDWRVFSSAGFRKGPHPSSPHSLDCGPYGITSMLLALGLRIPQALVFLQRQEQGRRLVSTVTAQGSKLAQAEAPGPSLAAPFRAGAARPGTATLTGHHGYPDPDHPGPSRPPLSSRRGCGLPSPLRPLPAQGRNFTGRLPEAIRAAVWPPGHPSRSLGSACLSAGLEAGP